MTKKSAPREDSMKGNKVTYGSESMNSFSTMRYIRESRAYIFKGGGNRLDEYTQTQHMV